MRHKNAFRKLNRTTAHRRSLFRNLATSLILLERFETTIQKAKEIRPIVERLVTFARRGDLHSRRQVYSYLMNKDAVHKLFADIAPRMSKRDGGYLRIVRTRFRHGDAAEMAQIEFVDAKSPAELRVQAPKKEIKKHAKKEKNTDAETEKAPAVKASEAEKAPKKAAPKAKASKADGEAKKPAKKKAAPKKSEK